MLGFKLGAVGGGTERGPGVESDVDVTHEAESVGPRIGMAGPLVNGRPGIDQRGLRVDDESVEIENQRANHGTYKPDEGRRSQAARGRGKIVGLDST